MFKLLGIGLIGIGWNIKINAYDELSSLRNTIKNEKTYIYPHDISQLGKEQHNVPENIVVKIPRFLIDKKYPVGEIKLNKIKTKTSTIIRYDEDGRIKITNNEEIKKELLRSCLLFPTELFKEFELEQRIMTDGGIKILFNNTITSKSNGGKNLVERYFTVIENSGIDNSKEYNLVPSQQNVELMSMALSDYDFELKENFINSNKDVYLIVEPRKHSLNSSDVKLNIVAIADNKDKIFEEKYSNQISELSKQFATSFIVIICGIGLLFMET